MTLGSTSILGFSTGLTGVISFLGSGLPFYLGEGTGIIDTEGFSSVFTFSSLSFGAYIGSILDFSIGTGMGFRLSC